MTLSTHCTPALKLGYYPPVYQQSQQAGTPLGGVGRSVIHVASRDHPAPRIRVKNEESDMAEWKSFSSFLGNH